MIPVEQALSIVLRRSTPRPSVRAEAEEALGHVLAESVTSDIDSPPHDKALMDGYAVRADDVQDGVVDLAVLEEIHAGEVPTKTVTNGTATRIMTGAPIPKGADAVVMVERTEPRDNGNRVSIDDSDTQPGQNILPRGASFASGDKLLDEGCLLRPSEIGLLAEIGVSQVVVHRRPRVAIVVTGNELTEQDGPPPPGMIRNSNGPMLHALTLQAGAEATSLGIARDDAGQLREFIRRGLREDVLVLSGGVSAGLKDLVPQALQQEGVEKVFHKVCLKPGKPLWFGIHSVGASEKLVFGLPGNPVSSFVCFELFVRSALDQMSNRTPLGLATEPAVLEQSYRHRGIRPTFAPAATERKGGQLVVRSLPWRGSADLRTLTDANCLARFPAGDRTFEAGEPIEVRML